jgi:hypothetical protein
MKCSASAGVLHCCGCLQEGQVRSSSCKQCQAYCQTLAALPVRSLAGKHAAILYVLKFKLSTARAFVSVLRMRGEC